MIGHQAIGVHLPVRFPAPLGQRLDEIVSVDVVQVDPF
jgi:hypothetical protein